MILWQSIPIFNCKKMAKNDIWIIQLPSCNVYLLALPERVESYKTLVQEYTYLDFLNLPNNLCNLTKFQ